jgi:glycosyltransferase involved in cell wall biosynthesis
MAKASRSTKPGCLLSDQLVAVHLDDGDVGESSRVIPFDQARVGEHGDSAVPVWSLANVGGIPEIVQADAGILVPPGDAPALAAALVQGLETSALIDRRLLAQRALSYSPAAVGSTLDAIYRLKQLRKDKD